MAGAVAALPTPPTATEGKATNTETENKAENEMEDKAEKEVEKEVERETSRLPCAARSWRAAYKDLTQAAAPSVLRWRENPGTSSDHGLEDRVAQVR